VDLRLLSTFRTVAELGSVSAASRRTLVGQPALTRQLQQLERQVGLALFAREGGRLVLTPGGARFLAAAVEVLEAAETAGTLARSLAAGRLDRVRAAAPTTTLTDVLAPFLATLSPEDPLITVEEAHHVEAVRGLRSRYDLAIVTVPPPDGLCAERIAVLPVWAHVAAGSSLAREAEVPLERLAASRLLVLDPSARSRRLLDESLVEAGVAARDLLECSNPQVAQALAAAGRGVAVLSDDPRFDLVPLRIRTSTGHLTLTLTAVWDERHHAADELGSLARRLSAFCAERYAGEGRVRREGSEAVPAP
jgi:DNA-binding transcriptional LysR family regulator